MKPSKIAASVARPLVVCALLFVPAAAWAQDDNAIAACLKAWGNHPFGSKPQYRTLQTSVKVFGIGNNTRDAEVTSAPTLILINTGVNVMGGSNMELLNPNGWYCLRATVNVMGGMNIRAHCKAHLASASEGATVLGNSSDNRGVTVMGSTNVERVDCS